MTAKQLSVLVLSASLSLGLLDQAATACSRILLNTDHGHVVGRTMDLYIPDHPKLVAYPRGIARDGAVTDGNGVRWVSKYGSVVVNSLGIATSDGMNEKGFVANLLYLHDSQYETRDTRPGVANAMVLQYLLDVSATVAEALAELDKVQIVSVKAAGREWPLHISISDATGDSAVIEFVNGAKVVHRGKDSSVMTNEPPLDWQLNNLKKYRYFGGTEPLPGDIDPASRFVRASAFLKTIPAPKDIREALAEVYSIVKTVSVPLGAENTSAGVHSEDTWPTLWTTLADAGDRLYFFQASGSPNMFWIDLGKINFAKGMPIKQVSGEEISLVGEVSSKLKPIKNKHHRKPV
ncbi:linear amide C-N hydrolase [Methylomagnum ishizawai]|uniref:linear amide C-N hydrolase n=1 Tax=Methylomagnum ishizawai TaxID=1760988 RepID=UPI001C3321F2|nr:linear amide C-N hydrolase [Methylomagnum ishizawai]BBL74136.1 choloylglycine hydrolase [Methylomagnum ishizawai]